ncbi:MAG: saccharopine dehydrogenase C-terminal domain-containing protein [Bacteroidota bacterium]
MSKRKILVIGAGRSTTSLINYLLKKSEEENLEITVGDVSVELAREKVQGFSNGKAIDFDVFNDEHREKEIRNADIVISMLPARFHIQVAKDCIRYRKPMVTASYISEEMEALNSDAKDAGIVIMNEVGVDPGIDHMSAKKVIDRVIDGGGKMLSFESFTGGLISPENDDNMWSYKFTWNPRNVVVAGQGGAAKFIQEGKYKYIPYNKLFRRTEFINIPGYGRFEAYANRDSLAYRESYGLHDIPTLYRGTFRRVGFSRAWNMLVELGLTDDSYTMEGSENMTYRDFVNSFLPYHPYNTVEIKLRHYLKIDQDDVVWDKFVCLDLLSDEKIVGIKDATPAQILQKILMEKWTLKSDDKDMIVMYHKFGYEIDGEKKQTESYMVVKGDDSHETAMAKTVGLPTAISALKILNGEISTPGIHIPINKEFYEPILEELREYGVEFTEVESEYQSYNPDVMVD